MATKSRIAAIVAAVVVAVALPAAAIVVLRDDAASGEHDLTPSKRVRVEVLNAAGRAGLAR